MDILGSLLGTGASALTGGMFGLAGNIASKIFGYVETNQTNAQRTAEWQHETELLKLQLQLKTEETENEQALLPAQSLDALSASIRAEAAYGTSYKWVDAARALVRPALTLGLASFLAAAFFAMPEGAADKTYVVDSLVFASVTAITWWFGDRAPRKTVRHG
ncbi:MAG TPA: hypothetical protein VG309_05345 [Rhizomicrobium sp.]|jgi:hypothetical protein|nr:hypothetical protein [Rhizomicrobium sp.]